MTSGPALADPSLDHGSHRITVGKGKSDVPEYHEEDREGEDVVDERGSGAPRDREEPEPLQHRTGGQHDDDDPGGEDGVQLLPRVELIELRRGAAEGFQPTNLLFPPPVDSTCVASHPGSPRPDQRHHHRDRQSDAGPKVDLGNEVATADDIGQRAEIQGQGRRHEDSEEESIGPVRAALHPIEPEDPNGGPGLHPGSGSGLGHGSVTRFRCPSDRSSRRSTR